MGVCTLYCCGEQKRIIVFIVTIFDMIVLQKRTGGLFFGVMIFYMIVLLCVLDVVEFEKRPLVVGSVCVVIGIIMYSSPMTLIVRFKPTPKL